MKESVAVHYLDSNNVAFMGCNIAEGGGKGIVIATGLDNQVPTPLYCLFET
jgi:magnesium-transporting ATPase (P-type)